MWGQLPEPPKSASFPGFRALEQLGVLGCCHRYLHSHPASPQAPWVDAGGTSQAQPPHTESFHHPFGSVHDFFHCSEVAELIQQYSLGQHGSFLKVLVLVFLKLCILRQETQHPLALEVFPDAVALVIPSILLPGEATALSLSCRWWMPSPPKLTTRLKRW